MRIGLALPQYDYSVPGEDPLTFATLAAHAVRAEELGYDSLWLSDHLFLGIGKYGGREEPYGAYEPIGTLGALARVVSRPRLGTLVLCEALRPPTVAAKALATLDRISGGRLDIGLGAGWYEPEYAAIGMEMPSAGRSHPPTAGADRDRHRPPRRRAAHLLGRVLRGRRREGRPAGDPAAAPARLHRRQG